jgi:hypothetical protein
MGLDQQILTINYCKVIHLKACIKPKNIEYSDNYMAKYSTVIVNLMQFQEDLCLVCRLVSRIFKLKYFSSIWVDLVK